jgi:sugar O-acyltransferase (sialic acid O-acetyltransferase NeuD family)
MKANDPVFVFGAGGQAKVVVSTLVAAGRRVGGLFDDDPTRRGNLVLGHPVLGTLDEIPRDRTIRGVTAFGDNEIRAHVVGRFTNGDGDNVKWVTTVHPNADVHSSARLGRGTVVFSGAVIQPDTIVGSHCIVNTSASVDHDSVLGDYVHVAPGCHLAGSARLGDGVFLGIGAVVSPGIRVGAWSTVGAGAVVVNDLAPRIVAVGVPARSCRKKDAHAESDSDGVPRLGALGHTSRPGSPPLGSTRTRSQN